jgi:hypothetical protein
VTPIQLLIPVLVAVSTGALATLLTVFFTRKKSAAEGRVFDASAADIIHKIAIRQLDYLDQTVTRLVKEIAEYRTSTEMALIREHRLIKRVKALEELMQSHGIPIPKGEG